MYFEYLFPYCWRREVLKRGARKVENDENLENGITDSAWMSGRAPEVETIPRVIAFTLYISRRFVC